MQQTDIVTHIYRLEESSEYPIGRVHNGQILRRSGSQESAGHVKYDGSTWRIYRRTQHDASEVGFVDGAGEVFSHGLFEGGSLGWVDDSGIVVQSGLILGEEEVGRIQGPEPQAAAGALLLILLPDFREEQRRRSREG